MTARLGHPDHDVVDEEVGLVLPGAPPSYCVSK